MSHNGYGHVVNSCPHNKTEVTAAATRLNCTEDKYGNNQYTCVPKFNLTALVEFCYDSVVGFYPKDHCLRVVSDGGLQSYSCRQFTEGCPSDHYRGSDLYQFPACYQINTEDRCFYADPSCPNKSMSYTTEDGAIPTESTSLMNILNTTNISSTFATPAELRSADVGVIIGSALAVLFVLCIVLAVVFWRRRRRYSPVPREDQELIEIQKKMIGEYSTWKTTISDKFSSLSDDEVCVLFCFLCSDSGTPDFTDTDCLDILNLIRGTYFKDGVTSEEAQRTLDGLKSRGFLWDEDGVHLSEDVNDETVYRVIGRATVLHGILYYVYCLSSYTTAVRYLRSCRYTRKSGEKCVISDYSSWDSLLIQRLQMNILTHVTMEDTDTHDEVSRYLNIPPDRVRVSDDERGSFLEELQQNGECIKYRGGSQDSVQHVNWLWRDKRPDIVRSCIGLHPHWDIYIINNTAYRKHSQYHDRPPAERCLLYCLLMVDDYTVKVKDESHIKVYNAIKEQYFTDQRVCEKITAPQNPEEIVLVENDVIKFKSDDIRHDVMYAFVTECLVMDTDLKFFLTTASCHVISEYCRSWGYKRSEGERCLYIPDEMYELFIDRLQLDILTHRTVSDWGIHHRISKRLKIPWEILKWDDAARRRYAKCASRETQKMHRARAMIVGCAGAGKSTLLKRLQKRSLDELNKVQSTVGLEVHEDIFEIDPESDHLKDLPHDTNREGKQLLSILDFGGQCAYYACHQVYLSRRAFYLLVLNMAMGFDEKVDKAICGQAGTMFTDWTYGEYMLFWLKSVHTYCESNAPVIIVGTHLDQTKGQDANTLYNRILHYLQYDKHLKSHLHRERCFVLGLKSDGSTFEDTLSELERCVVLIAKQDRWREFIPKDWALAEVVLRELRGQKTRMISIKELTQKCFRQLREKYTQMNDILKFFHDIGVILHFDDSSLAKTVIIDIQWFVDSFKNIITDPNHFVELFESNKDWLAFNETGNIEDRLLTNIWRSQHFDIGINDKEKLLQYMERLGLIFNAGQTHYIPCMNKRTFAAEQESVLKNFQSQTSVLVFRFPFLPFFFYFRLIVACLRIRNWEVVDDKGLWLFKNVACFNYKYHTVVLAVNRYSIQLQVFQLYTDSVSKDVTLTIRADIERILKGLASNVRMEIMYTVGYQCSQQEVFRELDDCFVEEEKLHGVGRITCPKHGMHHALDKSSISYHWNKDVLAETTDISNDTVLSERDVLKFNKVIGKDVDLIANCLGLSQVEVDRLKMENPTSMNTVVHKILLTWKSKLGNAATLETLEKSLQEVEQDTGASVDWKVFSKAKKDILKKKKK